MKLALADFVIQNEACIRSHGAACMQYPARPSDYQSDDWPYRCSWIMLPKAFDTDVESRIQALMSSTIPTTVVAVLAVQSDGSADSWSNSPNWPDALAIIESVETVCLREMILSYSSETGESLLSTIKALIHGVHNFHRHGIAHGNIHTLTIRINQGTILLPPILIGKCCFDIQYDYCPPEHLLSSDHYPSLEADIWSLACAVLEILSGQSTFCGVDPGQILHRQQSQLSIPQRERYLNLIDWRDEDLGCRRRLSQLLASMLSYNASERPSIWNVLEDFEEIFNRRNDFCIQVQPNIKATRVGGHGDSIVIGRTDPWWRGSSNQQSRLPSDRRVVPEVPAVELCREDMEIIQVDVESWYNNQLRLNISRVIVSFQFGDQIYTSSPQMYPNRSLNVSHRFTMNRNDIITICNQHPLLIRLSKDNRMEDHDHGVTLAITEVDLRPLLSGFPIIEGCYQLEPSTAGQITVKVQPMSSIDQRDIDSTINNPTWNLFQSFLLSD